jgi:hypothetical protein
VVVAEHVGDDASDDTAVRRYQDVLATVIGHEIGECFGYPCVEHVG